MLIINIQKNNLSVFTMVPMSLELHLDNDLLLLGLKEFFSFFIKHSVTETCYKLRDVPKIFEDVLTNPTWS